MVEPITAALMIAQIAGSLMGGNEDPEPIAGSEAKSGFAALPPEFQQAYINTYLPGALNLYSNGNYATPMGRASNDPFASRGLQELQAFSDRQRMSASSQGLNNPGNNMQANAAFGGFKPISLPMSDTALSRNATHTAIQNAFNNHILPQLNQYMGGGNGMGGGMGAGMGAGFGAAGMNANGGVSSGNPTAGLMNNGGLFPNMEGVRPLTVEPLNDIQRTGIMGMAGQPAMDPYSQMALGGMANFANNMFEPGFMQQRMQSFMNPYKDQVIDSTLNRMKDQVLGGTNSILGNTARLGGLGAFGSSALGTRLANMENEALKRTQDFIAQANSANFNQAQKGFFNSLPLQGGALTSLFNAGGAAQEQRRMTLQDMMNAGNQLQQQHQRELNEVSPYITGNLPQNKLSQLGNFLSGLPNSTIGAPQMQPGQPNFWSKLGGAATVAQGQMQPGGTMQSFMSFNQKNDASGGRPWIYD